MQITYFNGIIYCGDSFKEAFIVEDDRFIKIGTNEEICSIDTDLSIDLNHQFVCPSFNDSHMHLINYGRALLSGKLNEHTSSLSEMLEYVKKDIKRTKPGNWYKARGWNQDYFNDVNRMPNINDLDAISKDIPIILTRACGHACVVNSKVLELCHIDINTISPEGGEIGRQDNKLNGLLFDNAIELLNDNIPLPDINEIKEYIIASQKSLNSFGITSSQSDDYCIYRNIPFEMINKAYKELEEEGRLTVRVYEQSNFTNLADLKDFIDKGYVTGTGNDMFKIGPLKLLGDGSLGSRTAHLSRPYHDDPDTRGFSLFSQKEFDEMIEYAHLHNMQIAVHAIGDKCLDEVLDAYEKAFTKYPRENHRSGIVHCQISRADQLERMAKLNMHIYAQSIFLDYDNHIVYQRVDKDIADTSYSWKTLMDKGLTVSNGSDAPVEIPDVLKGIECAVTRKSIDGTGPYLPNEAFTVKQAIDSFTINGAIASFEEDYKGCIKENYLADFVILDKNPFETKEEEIHNIKVLKTYLGGKRIY